MWWVHYCYILFFASLRFYFSKLIEFNLGARTTCNTDYLEMYNVDQSTGQSSLVVKYCGGVSIISYDIQPVKKFNCAVKFR